MSFIGLGLLLLEGKPSPLSSVFHLLEYLLLFQRKEQGVNGILRACLSALLADRAIAAIFAAETAGNRVFAEKKFLCL
jgi:hypothetical protein